jgi:hypothetical protein
LAVLHGLTALVACSSGDATSTSPDGAAQDGAAQNDAAASDSADAALVESDSRPGDGSLVENDGSALDSTISDSPSVDAFLGDALQGEASAGDAWSGDASTSDAIALDAWSGDASTSDAIALDAGASDSSEDGLPIDASQDSQSDAGTFCALPGSVVWTAQGTVIVPGADAAAADLTWLTLPQGFCAHAFGNVGDARQLRFAPGGELFVASPTYATTGGNPSGAIAGIAVLADDNHDGFADPPNITFLSGVPAIQGLLFANNQLYYQDDTSIRAVPYRSGDRQPSGPSQLVATTQRNRPPSTGRRSWTSPKMAPSTSPTAARRPIAAFRPGPCEGPSFRWELGAQRPW